MERNEVRMEIWKTVSAAWKRSGGTTNLWWIHHRPPVSAATAMIRPMSRWANRVVEKVCLNSVGSPLPSAKVMNREVEVDKAPLRKDRKPTMPPTAW